MMMHQSRFITSQARRADGHLGGHTEGPQPRPPAWTAGLVSSWARFLSSPLALGLGCAETTTAAQARPAWLGYNALWCGSLGWPQKPRAAGALVFPILTSSLPSHPQEGCHSYISSSAHEDLSDICPAEQTPSQDWAQPSASLGRETEMGSQG